MDISWIEYKGRKILRTGYSEHTLEENILLLEEQGKIERENPGLLILSNFRGVSASGELIDRLKAYEQEFRNGTADVKNAVIGIDGLKKVFLNAYLNNSGNTTTKLFGSEEEAKDWLVE